MIKRALLTALTNERGGLLRVRDEDGKLDGTAILATVIRLAIIFGSWWIATQIGIL